MSYDAEIATIQSYNRWVMEQKAKGVDVSPEAYMLDVAKTEALEMLIKVQARINDPSHPDELAEDIAEILGVELEYDL